MPEVDKYVELIAAEVSETFVMCISSQMLVAYIYLRRHPSQHGLGVHFSLYHKTAILAGDILMAEIDALWSRGFSVNDRKYKGSIVLSRATKYYSAPVGYGIRIGELPRR